MKQIFFGRFYVDYEIQRTKILAISRKNKEQEAVPSLNLWRL